MEIRNSRWRKTISILSWIILLISLLTYLYRYEIKTLVYRIKYPSPMQWNGLTIDLPARFSFDFTDDKKILQIVDWKIVEDAVVNVKQTKAKSGQQILDKLKIDENTIIYDYKDITFNGEKSFLINLRREDQGIEYRLVYVFSENILLGLTGNDRDSFKQFDSVFDSIRFIEDDKSGEK